MAQIFWHSLELKEIFKILNTDPERGLDEKEVIIRQKEAGQNKLPEEKPLSSLEIFLDQFKSPLIYILLISGLITFFLKEWTDTLAIFGVVFLNAALGFFQENKASQALRKLKKTIKEKTEVLREGNLKIINSENLVPGDIVFLKSGDRVPADGRIIECRDLKINEMSLTGEWLPATKQEILLPENTPLADRDNMVYKGTIVQNGRAKFVVTEIGVETQIGKVAKLIKEIREEKTPYQRKVAHFSQKIALIIIFICFLILLEGIIKEREFWEMFVTAVAVAVAAIPEGLPVAISVILALGMEKILQQKGLVRKMVAAETLGSTSIIATDKTGTLTEGKMKVANIISFKKENEPLCLKAAVFTSEAFVENPAAPKEKWIFRGSPTDKALFEAGIEAGFDPKKDFEKKKIKELPFNSINKFAAAVYQENEEKILYVCGAPERILELSILEKKERENLEKNLEGLTQKGLRVVASAQRKIENCKLKIENLKDFCKDLEFLGFITLKDPIRKDVKEAIRICRRAGMRPIIVTGDHKFTAKAVAEKLGFKIKEENILTGKELDKISDENFERILDKIKLYARVEPSHKLRIIEAWQKKGKVVAMTGDGINDAPALKKADIGIALGSGTDVAKETADLVLLNDSFSTIVKAVEVGRVILDNIRKVITYVFSDSFSEVILVGSSILGGFPLPITAVQILWVNLIEDSLPAIALSFERKEKDIMKRKPLGKTAPLLTREMRTLIFIIGILTDFLLLGLFFWLFKFSNFTISHIRSIIFGALSVNSLFYVFSCKSLRRNLWHINPFSNKTLIVAVLCGFLLLIGAFYLPFFQILLKTQPISLFDWLIIFQIAMVEIILIEITKYYFITKNN